MKYSVKIYDMQVCWLIGTLILFRINKLKLLSNNNIRFDKLYD